MCPHVDQDLVGSRRGRRDIRHAQAVHLAPRRQITARIACVVPPAEYGARIACYREAV